MVTNAELDKCLTELRETQAKLADMAASNKLFSDCIHRAGVAYRKAHPERPDGEWPDGAEAFVWWVEAMRAEIERLKAASAESKYTTEMFDELVTAIEELVDTFKDILDGLYEPDLFQLNSAEAAISKVKGESELEDGIGVQVPEGEDGE